MRLLTYLLCALADLAQWIAKVASAAERFIDNLIDNKVRPK